MTRTRAIRMLAAGITFGLALVTIPAALRAQAGPDASRLRALFFQRDYETALLEGARIGASSSPEARAWHVLSQARRGMEDDAVAAARAMVKSAGGSGWSWLALAGALYIQGEKIDEAIQAGDKALQLMPGHPDAVWIRAQALLSDAKRRTEAIAFIDVMRSKIANPAQILDSKAYALYAQASGRTPDLVKIDAAFKTFEEARTLDPGNFDAWYLPASYLIGRRRADEAVPLAKQAIVLAPGSVAAHQNYWRAVSGSGSMSREAKDAAIKADLEPFLEKNPNRSQVLFAASSAYDDLKAADKQRALEDAILAKFPDSLDAEWVMANRWRAAERPPEGEANHAEIRRLMTVYINKPHHYIDGLLGETYRQMFFELIGDKDVNTAELKRMLDGMIAHETTNVHIVYGAALVSLADHKLLLADAERAGRDAVNVMTRKVAKQKDLFDGAGAYERAMSSMAALGYDALGWVLYAEGKNADAEQQLLKSYDMNHENRANLDHLGRFYEAKGDITRAESYYVKGLGVQMPGANPCEADLKALYAKSHPDGAGFDTFIADLREKDRARRHDTILADRVKAPAAAPAFDLRTLDGKRVSLDSLKGKVVAINFWGIWCGWCVQELPEYQKLFEKYKADPDVVILTIDNDHNPDDVPPWMTSKKYTFPVLYDDGFVAKAGITAFPTTWFLDREGRRAFVKVGWSEKLLEEFSWRLEALK